MRAKLQGAGYVQQAVKWDTDSDSDTTDEEDLAMWAGWCELHALAGSVYAPQNDAEASVRHTVE